VVKTRPPGATDVVELLRGRHVDAPQQAAVVDVEREDRIAALRLAFSRERVGAHRIEDAARRIDGEPEHRIEACTLAGEFRDGIGEIDAEDALLRDTPHEEVAPVRVVSDALWNDRVVVELQGDRCIVEPRQLGLELRARRLECLVVPHLLESVARRQESFAQREDFLERGHRSGAIARLGLEAGEIEPQRRIARPLLEQTLDRRDGASRGLRVLLRGRGGRKKDE